MLDAFLVGLSFVEGFLILPFVFYGLVAVLVILSLVSLNDPKDLRDEGWFGATLLSILLMALLCWKFGVSHLQMMPTILCFILYIAVGVVWSFGKWYFFLSKLKQDYLEFKEGFIQRNGVPSNFPNVTLDVNSSEYETLKNRLSKFQGHLSSKFNFYKNHLSEEDIELDPSKIVDSIKPTASAHKASITKWIMCWPLSFVWTMLNDPVRKLANAIFAQIKSLFQKMSDKIFQGV